jgi:Ser/Thr protein kinase RdoA (MazF antagonist)
VLAVLHGSRPDGLRPFGPVAQLVAATATADLVETVAPELRPRLDELLRSLTASIPEDPTLVPAHGDFNARQLLVANGDLAVTDFDAFCLAPAALDPATYTAYLVEGGEHDLDAALAVLEDLVGGYGTRPPYLSWYVATAILRRAARPFRYFEPDWQSRLERVVASAEAAARS